MGKFTQEPIVVILTSDQGACVAFSYSRDSLRQQCEAVKNFGSGNKIIENSKAIIWSTYAHLHHPRLFELSQLENGHSPMSTLVKDLAAFVLQDPILKTWNAFAAIHINVDIDPAGNSSYRLLDNRHMDILLAQCDIYNKQRQGAVNRAQLLECHPTLH